MMEKNGREKNENENLFFVVVDSRFLRIRFTETHTIDLIMDGFLVTAFLRLLCTSRTKSNDKRTKMLAQLNRQSTGHRCRLALLLMPPSSFTSKTICSFC